jgi:hypothetical protein
VEPDPHGRIGTALKNFENARSANLQNPQNLSEGGFADFAGSSPGQIGEIFPPSEDEVWVAFEERAAILEYDGGFSRDEAERMARTEIYGTGRRTER